MCAIVKTISNGLPALTFYYTPYDESLIGIDYVMWSYVCSTLCNWRQRCSFQ